MQAPHLTRSEYLIRKAIDFGLPAVISPFLKNSLTVLNYHRIDDPYREGFDTLKVNVSATPKQFEEQMAYVSSHFNVITCEYLVKCLHDDAELPPHAAMITFDDGYYDNLANAYPVLSAYRLPAVIFLATDYMERNVPFYWDYVSSCFYRTKKDSADLPVLGFRQWVEGNDRDALMLEWIEAVKRIPEAEKQRAVAQLDKVLEVDIPDDAFSEIFLTWDQVRFLSQNGIEFGAHTASHPILTRVTLEQAQDEIVKSKRRIEEEIGKRVVSLAYPNGGAADFSPEIMKIAGASGIDIAFSLLAGPTLYKTVQAQPFSIRRIFLVHSDSFERFVMKLNGGSRLTEALGR
jgi:peptidoglycan/xylan/chitin deacetylase (PgdA/CDA1 family)